VSGGGTAGHIYPALTVAEHVRDEEHSEVAFVGVPGSLEARLANEAGIDFVGVPAQGWDRSQPLTFVTAALTTAWSFLRCLLLLRGMRTDVVVGFGGYVSLPLGLAAAFAGVPLVLHEQNSVPGLANRVLSRWATTVCVTYAQSICRLARPGRALVTGDPVREAVLAGSREAGRAALGLKKSDLVLLVFGGSRGARHLNAAIVGLFPRLAKIPKLRVIQVAGPSEIDTANAALKEAAGGKRHAWWRVHEYIESMGDAIAAADLVVCRAGATTIAELTVLGRPSVLVPYPFATDDHQSYNAAPLMEAGAAVVISDSGLDSPAFGDEIVRLLSNPARRASMAAAAAVLAQPYAAHAVAEAAIAAGAAHSPWRLKERRAARSDGPHEPDPPKAPVSVAAVPAESAAPATAEAEAPAEAPAATEGGAGA
jgi:UDP-N-acetylglucosamine--N-acetylmuramyl-(pentapeptide) pyrophosphoryl-undecaprenol N-acetylglucosamine transferase